MNERLYIASRASPLRPRRDTFETGRLRRGLRPRKRLFFLHGGNKRLRLARRRADFAAEGFRRLEHLRQRRALRRRRERVQFRRHANVLFFFRQRAFVLVSFLVPRASSGSRTPRRYPALDRRRARDDGDEPRSQPTRFRRAVRSSPGRGVTSAFVLLRARSRGRRTAFLAMCVHRSEGRQSGASRKRRRCGNGTGTGTRTGTGTHGDDVGAPRRRRRRRRLHRVPRR
mmetsp:Transcript_7560/g.32140  ORF Transcript_7560/g.32140 Transcript_7560/m.32140 type:complete len:228 (-) Transcript_7560:54-737(-)